MNKKTQKQLKELMNRANILINKLNSMMNSTIWDFEAEDILKHEIHCIIQDFKKAGGAKEDWVKLSTKKTK